MNVFLVEDSAPVRERLVELIEASGEHHVIGHAETCKAAVAGIADTRPDVGIFDIKLACGNGIDAFVQAKRLKPTLVGIVMSNYATPQHLKASADAGAQFFLDKSGEFERVTEILASIAGNNFSTGAA